MLPQWRVALRKQDEKISSMLPWCRLDADRAPSEEQAERSCAWKDFVPTKSKARAHTL